MELRYTFTRRRLAYLGELTNSRANSIKHVQRHAIIFFLIRAFKLDVEIKDIFRLPKNKLN